MKRLIWIVLLGSVFFLLSGCLFASRPVSPGRSIYQILQVNDIQAEINRREALADPDNENHFALVVLYTHPRNQHPDYPVAERHLNEYLVNLAPEDQDWQARYIYYLLQRINASDEIIHQTQKQLELETTERLTWQSRSQSDKKKAKAARAALQKIKKESGQLRLQLKKAQKKSAMATRNCERQRIENEELKKQIKDLTDLYLDLEKKRQAMQ